MISKTHPTEADQKPLFGHMYRDGPDAYSFQFMPETVSYGTKWGLILSLTIPNMIGNMIETLVETINFVFVGHLTLLEENERIV